MTELTDDEVAELVRSGAAQAPDYNKMTKAELIEVIHAMEAHHQEHHAAQSVVIATPQKSQGVEVAEAAAWFEDESCMYADGTQLGGLGLKYLNTLITEATRTLKQPSSVEVTVEEAEIVDRSEPFFSGDTWEMQAAVEAITRAGYRITRAAATDGVKS